MKKHKNTIQIVVGSIIGFILLYVVLKDFDFSKLIASLQSANWFYVLLNGFFLWLVYYFRAMRWNVLLRNANIQVKRNNLIYSVMLGYFVNSLTPKLGEIVRCKILYDREKVPIPLSIATVVVERAYDVVVLFLGVFFVFVLNIDILDGLLNQFSGNSGVLLSLLIVGAASSTVFIYLLLFLRKRVTAGILKKMIDFFYAILHTLKNSIRIAQYWKFLLYTVFIWTTLVLMNYVCMLALPETLHLPLSFTIVVLFISGIGWAMPVPNGIGFTHIIVDTLFIAFSYSETAGKIFGFVSNSLTLLFTLVIGGSYFLISLLAQRQANRVNQ